jgi:serine protease inhibitor
VLGVLLHELIDEVQVRQELAALPLQYEAMVQKKVALKLPRFRIDADYDLSEVLMSMHITEPFSESTADFSPITVATALPR